MTARYDVIAVVDERFGEGFTLHDRLERRITGGWFADRSAAEWTARALEGDPPRFTCPRCGRTSYNPNDVRAGYCGHCHDWSGTPTEDDAR